MAVADGSRDVRSSWRACAAFLWDLFGGVIGAPAWVHGLAPFEHIGLVPAAALQATAAAVMLAAGLAAAAAAVMLFSRRDRVRPERPPAGTLAWGAAARSTRYGWRVRGGDDPYAVLGVGRGATEAAIHAGYRAAVRRTHPDAGGSAAAFEAVQEAYELLRDPRRRRAWDAGHAKPRAASAPPRGPAPDAGAAHRAMDDLLAESQRLEDELAGIGRRRGRPADGGAEDEEDSIGAVLRDAGQQLSTAAGEWSRELGRLFRRLR